MTNQPPPPPPPPQDRHLLRKRSIDDTLPLPSTKKPITDIIGSGSFGTVKLIGPNKVRKQFVPKVSVKNNSVIQTFYEKQGILNNIDKTRYFLGGYASDVVPIQIDGKEYVSSFTMPHQGEPLNKVLHSGLITDLRVLIIQFLNLLYSIKLLSDRGYYHGDIKTDNILLNQSNQSLPRLVLIDYDFMNNIPNELDEKNRLHCSNHNVFNHNYPLELWYQCVGNYNASRGSTKYRRLSFLITILRNSNILVDMHVINLGRPSIFQSKTEEEIYKNLLDFVKENKGDTMTFFGLMVNTQQYMKPMIETISIYSWLYQFILSVNKYKEHYERTHTHLLDVSKIDVYSVGIVALEIFFSRSSDAQIINFARSSSSSKSNIALNKYNYIIGIVQRMIHPDFEQRISATEAYELWYQQCVISIPYHIDKIDPHLPIPQRVVDLKSEEKYRDLIRILEEKHLLATRTQSTQL